MPTLFSSLVLSLAGWGDAFLYPILSLNAAGVGVPVAWVGVLLSVNKLIRLGGNHLVAFAIGRLKYKPIVILGAVLATLTTVLYGLTPSVWIWLVARVGWGLAFAALRICTMGYATESKKMGVHLGASKAIHAFGPMLALLVGPLIVAWTDVQTTFLIFGAVTAVAIPLAFQLPDKTGTLHQTISGKFPKPRWFDGLIFTTALADGILVVTLGILLLNQGISETLVLGATALLLAAKRLGAVVMGPLSGWLADQWRLTPVFLFSIGGFVVGLCLIGLEFIVIGAVVAFISNSVNLVLSPGVAVSIQPASKLTKLSALTTWQDLGTALGVLLGGILLMQSTTIAVYFGLATIITGFTLTFVSAKIKEGKKVSLMV
ncbi:hypothetical protein JYT44_01060 [Caldithrix abyssi]|nr:hypothetical protein [Caldithrix abyssi]